MSRKEAAPMQPVMRSNEKGSIAIEFVLVASLIFVPMILGVMVIGNNLIRAIQVNQIARDTGHMYALDVDFTDPGGRALLLRLANGLSITDSGGNGVVIFSTVTFIGQAQCDAAGLTADQCTNLNYYVCTKRQVVGNASLRAGNYGTPDPSLIDAQGNVANSLTDSSTRMVGFETVTTLDPGSLAYLTESYFSSPDLDIPGFVMGSGVYARSVF